MFAKSITFILVALCIVTQTWGYAQLSSTQSQVNAVTGKALTYNQIDAIDAAVIGFTLGGSEVTLKKAGTYFIIAAPQVGFSAAGSCKTKKAFTADYWLVAGGQQVANSNVRMAASSKTKDVIVTQGVGTFTANTKISIFGAGACSQSEYILPAGEPAIPSIILSVFLI
jgi:hypothetical protein